MYSKIRLSASSVLTPAMGDVNPRKPGTRGHASFALILAAGTLTYGEYLKAGGRNEDVTWDHARGWVAVDGKVATVQVPAQGKLARDGNPVARKAPAAPTLEAALAVVREAAHAEALIEDAARLEAAQAALVAEAEARVERKSRKQA